MACFASLPLISACLRGCHLLLQDIQQPGQEASTRTDRLPVLASAGRAQAPSEAQTASPWGPARGDAERPAVVGPSCGEV